MDKKKHITDQMIYGKIAPQAPELEAAVLGALLLESPALDLVFNIISTPDVFYSDANQRIFNAIQTMFSKGNKIDFMTVGEHLRKTNELELVGGAYYITNLTRDVVSSANIENHSRIILEKYALREMIKASSEIIAKCYNDDDDVFDIIEQMASAGTNIMGQIVLRQYEHISKPVARMLDEAVESSQKETKMLGVPTGFNYLNRITGGWQKTDLIILAARPSVGKTAFILNLVLSAATDHESPTNVGVFSLEMGSEQLAQRIVANYGDIELGRIKNGELNQQEFEKLFRLQSQIKEMGIYIDDDPSLGMTQLRAKARKMVRENEVGMIVIDYLQLMNGDKHYRGNREQEISQISRDLKMLAKELQIPIIALSQMSRNIETRSNNEPMLSDLRESGAIEQDADLVGFLYPNSKDDIKKDPRKAFERNLKIAKHRNGRTGFLVYDFDGAKQRFHNEDETVVDVSWAEVPKPPVAEISSPTTQIESPNFEQGKILDEEGNELPF